VIFKKPLPSFHFKMNRVEKHNLFQFALQLKMDSIRNLFSSKLTRKGTLSLIDQGLVSATNFLTGVFVGRYCTKEEYGLYMLCFTIILYLIELQNRLLSIPYTYFWPRLKQSIKSKYTGSIYIHQFFLSINAILALLFIGPYITNLLGLEKLTPVLRTLAAVIFFVLVKEHLRKLLLAQLSMFRAFILDSCVAVLQIGGLLIILKLGMLSSTSTFFVMGLVSTIITLPLILTMRKSIVPSRNRVLPDLRRNWVYGKWLLFGSIFYFASTNLYHWILASSSGASATGILAACLSVIFLANPIVLGFANFVGPAAVHVLTENGIQALRAFIRKAVIFLTITMGLFSFAIFIFGETLLVSIYGEKYNGYGFMLAILMISFFIATVTSLYDLALCALGRADANFKFNLVALLTTISLGFWLVRHFGLIGAAYGILSSNALASIVRYFIYTRAIHAYHES